MGDTKKYFYGYEVSKCGLENRRVDFATLAKVVGDMVLNNGIMKTAWKMGFVWELENGEEYDGENDYYYDICQYYIIDWYGAEILKKETNEIVYYCPELDMYLWGITHYGTAWDYVLTDIELS